MRLYPKLFFDPGQKHLKHLIQGWEAGGTSYSLIYSQGHSQKLVCKLSIRQQRRNRLSFMVWQEEGSEVERFSVALTCPSSCGHKLATSGWLAHIHFCWFLVAILIPSRSNAATVTTEANTLLSYSLLWTTNIEYSNN